MRPRWAVLAIASLLACRHSSTAPLIPATLIEPASVPYPPALFQRRIEGEVLLYLLVDSTGVPVRDSTRVVRSGGHPDFDAAALQAAAGLRFHPATRDGRPVTAPLQLPIRFTLPDSLMRH